MLCRHKHRRTTGRHSDVVDELIIVAYWTRQVTLQTDLQYLITIGRSLEEIYQSAQTSIYDVKLQQQHFRRKLVTCVLRISSNHFHFGLRHIVVRYQQSSLESSIAAAVIIGGCTYPERGGSIIGDGIRPEGGGGSSIIGGGIRP